MSSAPPPSPSTATSAAPPSATPAASAADAASTGSGQRPVRHGVVLAVTCLALASVVSAMSSLNVALPSIGRSTHGSQTELTWIVDAYSLAFASLLLPAGALGDRFGRRRALLVGLVVFGAGSAAATATTAPAVLIALRGVLGLGAALVMPATLATITTTFPREQRPRAVGVWAAVAGASAIVGLLASGTLLHFWSWQAVFGLNVVLAALAVAGTLRFVPESAERDRPPLDAVGALLALLGLAAVVYSVIEAPERGWGGAATLGGLAAGVLVLVGFTAWELRRDHPMLDPRLFRKPVFAAGSLSVTLQFLAFFGFVLVLMQYLQLVRGDSPLLAAVSVLPTAAGMIPATRLSPLLGRRLGVRPVWTAGLVLIAVGMAVCSRLGAHSPYLLLLGGLVPLGLGMGLAMTPATTAITDALPPALQNVGSAVNDLSRELGGALGIAVLSSVLGAAYRSRLSLPGTPEPVAERARGSLAAAAGIGGPVLHQAQAAFLDGMRLALYGASAAALTGAVAVAVLLRRGRAESAAGEVGDGR